MYFKKNKFRTVKCGDTTASGSDSNINATSGNVRKDLRFELTTVDGVTKLRAPLNKECLDNMSDYDVVTF
jgi:hypothetical protein